MIIYPYIGVKIENNALIKFGMLREQIRTKLNVTPQEFFKTPDSQLTTDAFDNIGLHAYYDSENQLEALEFFENNIIFKERYLFQFSYGELENWLTELDPQLEIEEIEGFTSCKFGISAWFPYDERDKYRKNAESILVFARNYYKN